MKTSTHPPHHLFFVVAAVVVSPRVSVESRIRNKRHRWMPFDLFGSHRRVTYVAYVGHQITLGQQQQFPSSFHFFFFVYSLSRRKMEDLKRQRRPFEYHHGKLEEWNRLCRCIGMAPPTQPPLENSSQYSNHWITRRLLSRLWMPLFTWHLPSHSHLQHFRRLTSAPPYLTNFQIELKEAPIPSK